MSTTPLQQLKLDFDAWRQSKTSPQSRIPQPLRQRAAALRLEYSDEEIVRTLKITEPRLLNWAGDTANNPDKSANALTEDFIALALPPSTGDKDIGVTHENTLIELKGGLGQRVQWTLQGQFSPQQLQAIVGTLMQGPGGES